MTATRAIGWFFGSIINAIVRWLALSKIHPNVLTFLGLLINIWAAWLFAAGSFRWAGVVVTGAAIFDMVARAVENPPQRAHVSRAVDQHMGGVAIRRGQLPLGGRGGHRCRHLRYGGRTRGTRHQPGDALRRLLRFRAGPLLGPGAVHRPAGVLRRHQSLLLHRAHRHRHDGVGNGQLYAGAGGERHSQVQSGFPGASGARRADHHRRPVRSHGRGVVGDRGAFQRHRGPPHDLHLPAGQTAGRRPIAPAHPPGITTNHSLTVVAPIRATTGYPLGPEWLLFSLPESRAPYPAPRYE